MGGGFVVIRPSYPKLYYPTFTFSSNATGSVVDGVIALAATVAAPAVAAVAVGVATAGTVVAIGVATAGAVAVAVVATADAVAVVFATTDCSCRFRCNC